MIIECDRCYARYRYDEARFEGKASKKVRCTKCLAIFDIFNAHGSAPASPALRDSVAEDTVLRLADGGGDPEPATPTRNNGAIARPGGAPLRMPADSRVSVAVIAGPDSGRIYAIEKPRVVIGRHDADVNVDDPEISRHHAAIELTGDTVTLVDLGSTNGTFVGEERIRDVVLENQAEFSIGGSTLMLIVTEKGS
ncbi:MAG: zinc-ribbon domain-containing protein [Acidobacteria bacterium]|nr:zinc-ribbon domain-containing protein [Acidobacteriota bacterium]MCA1611084.1 zinc-ribbon domain-containing protein [Acidobacteriota bacterium]